MRINMILVVALLFGCASAKITTTEWGTFVGDVVTRWVDGDDGRKMQLEEDFKYIDPAKVEWDAPKGWLVDGASIPQFAWSFIGGPYEGLYRKASVIHDVACDQKKRPWQEVHRAFYNAMLAGGVSEIKAKIMYGAVYLGGPRWDRVVTVLGVRADQISKASMQLRTSNLKGELYGDVQVVPSVLGSLGSIGSAIGGIAGSRGDGAKDVRVTFSPTPEVALNKEQFEKLQSFIETQNPSLEEIEGYKN